VFARCEDDLADCNHPFLADSFADHCKRLLSDFAIWNDEVWVAQVEFVDLRLRDELINLDDALAFNGDGLKLLWFKLDIFALSDLVAFDDLAIIHLITGFSIDLSVADAIAGIFVELVEADLLPLRGSWKTLCKDRVFLRELSSICLSPLRIAFDHLVSAFGTKWTSASTLLIRFRG
jgi:hypothetical protein